jgi:hypothetical protein
VSPATKPRAADVAKWVRWMHGAPVRGTRGIEARNAKRRALLAGEMLARHGLGYDGLPKAQAVTS